MHIKSGLQNAAHSSVRETTTTTDRVANSDKQIATMKSNAAVHHEQTSTSQNSSSNTSRITATGGSYASDTAAKTSWGPNVFKRFTNTANNESSKPNHHTLIIVACYALFHLHHFVALRHVGGVAVAVAAAEIVPVRVALVRRRLEPVQRARLRSCGEEMRKSAMGRVQH